MKTRLPFLLHSPVLFSLLAATLLVHNTQAQITVTTLTDENDTPAGAQVSLREAVRDVANGGQITFNAALKGKVLLVTAGEMTVAGKTVTVAAPDGLTIDAHGLSRIFNVAAGAGLNLSGLTLQGGKAPAEGGAIVNGGALSLTDCVLRDNRAGEGTTGASGPPNQNLPGYPGGQGGPGSNGGAVSNIGSLSALRCYFAGNVAGTGGTGGMGGNVTNTFGSYSGGAGGTGGTGGSGGAISSAGPLVLTACLFDSNQSGTGGTGGSPGFPNFQAAPSTGGRAGEGGAVFQTGGMTVDRCSFTGNICPEGASGRGMVGTPGVLGAAGSGTAVYWMQGTATLTNCTLTANGIVETATPSAGERGGAVAAGPGTLLRLVHCTLSGNLGGRTSAAAGIVSSAPVQCDNCILSGNRVDRSTNATPVLSEVNISPDTPRSVIPFSPLGETIGMDAQLGTLSAATGLLPVLVPAVNSPARNAGAIISGPPVTDQRGLPRPVGRQDLGAVEVQTAEAPARAFQTISFLQPGSFQVSDIALNATSSSGLPVSFEFISGPATLNGNVLIFTAPGLAAVRASQPGDATTAPALPVVRLIEVSHFIAFTPASPYTVFPQLPATVTLPATTFAGLPVTWSIGGSPGAGASLNGNKITATSAGILSVRGQSAGNAQYAPVDYTWSLAFVQGLLWWETPPVPFGGPPWFPLVEGSPHGLKLTVRLAAPHTAPVPVPVLPAGVVATPAVIPAGETSVECLLTVPANPLLTNHYETVATGNGTPVDITLFVGNRRNVPLDVFAPAHAFSGALTAVDVSCPGLPTPLLTGPPPDLGVRSFTVSAVDFDNPAIPIPVTLNAATADAGPYPRKHLQVTFPAINRRARITVTTDDGLSGEAGPIQIDDGAPSLVDIDADGDGINDLVEEVLQHTAEHFDKPPLVFERVAAGVRVVLASRPVDLNGSTLIIELSDDLQTWTPAAAAATTVTLNAGGVTENVSVLLPVDTGIRFARLRATKP